MQNRPQLTTLALMLATVLAAPTDSALAFDRQKLMSGGQVYAVALHDSYLSAAKEPETKGDAARYFEGRARAIENGEDLAPAKPSAARGSNGRMRRQPTR